jgi:hypothetical protein
LFWIGNVGGCGGGGKYFEELGGVEGGENGRDGNQCGFPVSGGVYLETSKGVVRVFYGSDNAGSKDKFFPGLASVDDVNT